MCKFLCENYGLSFAQIADLTDYQINHILLRPHPKRAAAGSGGSTKWDFPDDAPGAGMDFAAACRRAAGLEDPPEDSEVARATPE